MKLEHLIDQAAGQPKKTVAVAVAEDHEVIEAVAKAIQVTASSISSIWKSRENNRDATRAWVTNFRTY